MVAEYIYCTSEGRFLSSLKVLKFLALQGVTWIWPCLFLVQEEKTLVPGTALGFFPPCGPVLLRTAHAFHPVPSCSASLFMKTADGVEVNSLSTVPRVEIFCSSWNKFFPPAATASTWRSVPMEKILKMGKSSKDASCFLLSPLWWLCQLFCCCDAGVLLQILQFLPLFHCVAMIF